MANPFINLKKQQDEDNKQEQPKATTGNPFIDLPKQPAQQQAQPAKQKAQPLNAADALADVAGRITKAAADKKGTDLNKQRSSLMNQLQTVQDSAAFITDPDAANANKAEERRIINQLNVLDKAQGNADRYYSNADRAGGVLRSWGNRTAGSYLSTAAFGGQLAEAQDETGRAIADSAYAGYATDPLAIENMRRSVEQNGAPESIGVFKTNREMLAKADELLSRSEQETAKVYEGAGKADRILADLSTGALDLGADALASTILPGSGLFAMGARTFGQGTYDQRKEGGSLGKQFLNGAKSAAIEILTEKIGGPFEKIYGNSMTGKAVNAFISRFDNPIVQRGLSILSSAFSEGAEEFLSDVLNPVADRLLQLDDGTGKIFKEGWLQNALYDALIGGILGALGEGVKVAPGQRNAPSIEATKDNAVRGALEAVDRAVQERAQAETAEATQDAAGGVVPQDGNPAPAAPENAQQQAPGEFNSANEAGENVGPQNAANELREAAEGLASTRSAHNATTDDYSDGAVAFIDPSGKAMPFVDDFYRDELDITHENALAQSPLRRDGVEGVVKSGYIRVKPGNGIELSAENGVLTAGQEAGLKKLIDNFGGKTFYVDFDVDTESGLMPAPNMTLAFSGADIDWRHITKEIDKAIRSYQQHVNSNKGGESVAQTAAPAVATEQTAQQEAERPVKQKPVGKKTAQQTQTEERAAEDVGPYEGEPGAEAPAPAQPAAKKTTATEATRKLQEKYGDGLRTQETRGKIQSLARQARETDFSDPAQVRSLWESAKQQAREILNTTEDPSARTGGDTGGEIRNYLRGQKIRIDERLRNDRPSEYESLLELRRKTFGTLNFSNTEGMTLDQVYQELGYMFGEGLFPQDTMSHSEIVERILDAVANEKGQGYTYEQSLSDAEYERASADLAMELMRAAEGVTGTTIPTPVRETQQSLTLEQEREAAIESELDADFEGELTREDAERIVDERYEAYGEYDLDKILNGLEDSYGEAGEEADDFDEYAYYAERYRAADAENADEAADAGGSEELPETVGQGTPERGLAAYEPAGVGEVRGPGSLAPDGEVNGGEGAAESGPEPGQKRSKTESHTLQNMAERLGGEQDELYYTPKSERESLANAINRVDADMGGEMQKLLDKEMWNGEDIDTALTIQGMLQLDGVQTGDFSAAQAWARAIQARGTESGRALQAFSKWTRSGAAAAAQSVETLLEAENLTEEDRTRISNDVYQFGRDYDSIEDGDLDGIRDLIKRQARYRNTWTFGKKGFERMLNEVTDFEWLKEYAMRQLMNIPGDYTQKADLGQKVKTWQVLAQLSRLGTFFRNIGGNGVFGIQDTLSQDFFGVALDAMLGKFTGKRTLNLDKGWLSSEARKGARQGLVRSVLEVAGDVDMDGSGNRYDQTVNRTFKMTGGALSRLMSRWEQLLGYSLTTSDRTFRGGIEAEQQRGLSGFENLTEEERQALAQNMADYRLFQNHGVAYGVSKGMHDIANLIGFGGQRGQLGRQGGFGAGDLLMPYPGVPANLGVKALEYSPLNVAKGLTEMVKLLSDAKTGGKIDVKKQQNAVMDMARGLHGTALLAGLAALFKAGLFKNADDEDDKDAKALASAEGRQGVQMNLSGILRYLQGGSAEWKDGDQLMKIDWLEPMNAFLAIASMAADENDLPGYVGATFDGTLQSILDMPVMESFSNIFDNYNYSKGETVREKLGDVAVGFAADALTGMLPAPVSQTARAMDPYYRETIGEDAADTALRRVMNAIPGLRQQLDPKLDNFGRPKEQASSAYNRWMNSFVRPGQISDYKLGDVEQALDEFAQRTGEAVYPDRKAPNSFSAGGEKIQLSGEEKQAYQTVYGQAALQYYGEILLGDEYRDASDGEKQWLLDQAEAYAAYQAKKAILEQRGETYSNSSWDKMDALEEKGGNPFGYLFAKQGLKTAVAAKDYSGVDALLGDIDKMDKATKEQLFADVNRLDDRVEAHKAGIDTVLWEAAYAQKKKLEEDKNTTAVQDTISFAQWADSQKDLNRKQKDLLREQMGFYTTFRADAEKFDQLTGAGLSSGKAGKVWNAINALEPLEGKKTVSAAQKVQAISGMRGFSDAEKWTVFACYLQKSNESLYKKAMKAKDSGKSFDQWAKEYAGSSGSSSGSDALSFITGGGSSGSSSGSSSGGDALSFITGGRR